MILQRESDDQKGIIFSIFKQEISLGKISKSDVEFKFFLLVQRMPDIEESLKKRKAIKDLIHYEIKKTQVPDELIPNTSNFQSVGTEEYDEPVEIKESMHEDIPFNSGEFFSQLVKRTQMEFSVNNNLLIQNHLANCHLC